MKQTASESGIQLLSAPHMSTSPPGKQRSMIYTMLLALLGISSTFAVFLSMFDLQVNYSMLIGGILLCWVDEAESVSEIDWQKLSPTV